MERSVALSDTPVRGAFANQMSIIGHGIQKGADKVAHFFQKALKCLQDNVSQPKLVNHDFKVANGIMMITKQAIEDTGGVVQNTEVVNTLTQVMKGTNAMVSLFDAIDALQYFVGAGRDGKPEVVQSWNDSRYATIGSRFFNLGSGTFGVIDWLGSQGIIEPIQIFGESAKSFKDGFKVTGFVFDFIDACDLIRRIKNGDKKIDWFGDVVLLIAGSVATTCLIVFGSSQGAYGLGALLIVSSGIGIYKGIYKSNKEFAEENAKIELKKQARKKDERDVQEYREHLASAAEAEAARSARQPAPGSSGSGSGAGAEHSDSSE